jgi:hypothetical protein
MKDVEVYLKVQIEGLSERAWWRSGSGWNSVGVVSVFNLESSGVEAPERRPRHDKRYHEV